MTKAQDQTTGSEPLHVALLGPGRITQGALELTSGIKYRRTLALLAYLMIERNVHHSRDHLADLLWPRLPAEAARANLRQVLGNLGRLTPDAALRFPGLEVTRHTVCVAQHPGVELDLAWLDAPPQQVCQACVEQACALTRPDGSLPRGVGQDLLAGFTLNGADGFEEWLEGQRVFYRHRSIDLLQRLADCAEGSGRPELALDLARRLEVLDPLDEPNQRCLMRALARTGQTDRALLQFDTFAKRVERDLGVTPDAETCLLRADIARGVLEPAGQAPVRDGEPPRGTRSDEHRTLTVMCCECVAPGRDPEDSVERNRALRLQVIECLSGYGGHVVSAPGKAVIAYFGWPRARDAAPSDALRAALALQRRFAGVAQVRTGLHCGRTISAEAPDEVGELSETAIRLRLLALEGEVIASQAIIGAVGKRFEHEAVVAGEQLSTPSLGTVYRVRAENTPPPLSESDREAMIGRSAELGQLIAHWTETRQSRGRLVLVSGEPGIGKSTLVAHFARYVADTGGIIRAFTCRPELRLSPLAPLGGMFEARCGIGPEDSPATRRQKLRDFLQRDWADRADEAFPLLVDLLDPDADATHNKEGLFRLILGMFAALGKRSALLLVLEDAHWADAATLEFLDRLKLTDLPIMTLTVSRQEGSLFHSVPHAARIAIGPLGEASALALLQSLPSTATVAPAQLSEMARRAGGIPLYLRELAKLAGDLAAGGNLADIPDTLQAVLRQRIDSTGDDATILCAAAVIGQRFEHEVLSEIVGRQAALHDALQRLAEAGLLIAEPDGRFRFSHALVRDAAYQSMTRLRRNALHLRVATALSAIFPNIAETRPEIVAWHCTAGGDPRHGLFWWEKAGRLAGRRQAAADAVGHYRSALDIIDAHPHLADNATRLALMFDLGDALILAEGFGSLRARQLMEQALAIATETGDQDARFMALARMYQSDSSHSEHARGLDTAFTLQAEARTNRERMFALYALGNSHFWRGNFDASREALEALHRLAESSPPTERNWFGGRSWHGGDDVAVTGQSFLGLTLWFLGDRASAATVMANARRLGALCGNEHSHCFALAFSALLERCCGNAQAAGHFANRTRELAERHGFALWVGVGMLLDAWAKTQQGELDGTGLLEQGSAAINTAYRGGGVTVMSVAVEALMALNRVGDALELADRALLAAEELAEQYYVAELLRLRGEALLQIDAPRHRRQAEQCFRQAIDLASRQNARALLERAQHSLARLQGTSRSVADGLHDAHDATADAG